MAELERIRPDEARPLRRAEYDRMVAMGLFEGEHVELLRGLLVRVSPQNTRHAEAIRRLNRLLVLALGERAVVDPQLPFAASDDSEPEPDLAVVPPGDYSAAHPAEALLVVEVADVSRAKDRSLKAALYAEVGVPEYWIVDVVAGRVEVLRDPQGGAYAEQVVRRRGETVAPASLPGVELAVSDFLPG